MTEHQPPTKLRTIGEVSLLMVLFFVYAGDPAPMVNEAHYLVKAKNFWQPDWCAGDLFAASGKAHTTFYVLLGWPTKFVSLEATAWIGRIVGWLLLAIGIHRLSWRLLPRGYVSIGVAVIWIAGIEYGNLAGEWVVGGTEAKVPAYGFVLMALAEMVDRRWNRVWLLLGLASAFHVLSGGWSVVAAMLVWLATESGRDDKVRFFSPALFAGGAIALFGLVPALRLTMGAGAEDSVLAAQIYSYFRIAHHLLPAEFRTTWFIRHGVLIAATATLFFACRGWPDRQRWQKVSWFTWGAVLIAAVGLGVGCLPPYLPDLAAKLLRYYWFRLTDAIVPLALALMTMRLIVQAKPEAVIRYVGFGLLLIAVGLVAYSSYDRARVGVPPSAGSRLLGFNPAATPARQQKVFQDWLAVCDWARLATPSDEIFLTPRHQQTFKWYAERAEVVNWKDVPQDAASLKEWERRFREIFPSRLGTIRVTIQYAQLKKYREKYGVRFMIVDRRITGRNLPLVRIYPIENEVNDTYAVYELPQ